MEKQIVIGGKTLELNSLDVDFMLKLEEADRKFIRAAQGDEGDDNITLMTKQAAAGYSFIDDIWGDGVAEEVFSGRRDLDEIFDVYVAIYDFIQAQNATFKDKVAAAMRVSTNELPA
jgi:hypothetical protein